MTKKIDHLVVTSPDRYYGEGIKILWVDWMWEQMQDTLAVLQGSPEKLVIHVFDPSDSNFRWLLDVAHQSDIVIINLGINTVTDPFKGYLLSLDKVKYFGRKDLSDIFPGYIEDPQGTMLVLLGEMANKRNE